jgi:hypothetical protein
MRLRVKVTRGDFFISPIWPRIGLIPRRKGSPSFSKGRRLGLIDRPVEEIIRAGPCVDFDPADLAIETAGMLIGMRLFGCRVRHPAFRAVEIFGRPCASGHAANMRCETTLFQRVRLPELTDPYRDQVGNPTDSLIRPRFSINASTKTPANRPGFREVGGTSSVTRERPAELVVDLYGEEIDVLFDVVGDEEAGR